MKTASLGNGIDLQYQRFGAPEAPAIIAVLGITDNITDWPDTMVTPLVDAGYQLIRYELRDMGHSTHCGPDTPINPALAVNDSELLRQSYNLHDMVADLLGLMDHLGISKTSLVGYSYGGAIAQLFAVHHPERIERLVCLQSSNYDSELPPRSEAVMAAMAGACQLYASEQQAIDAIVALRLAVNGSGYSMSTEEAEAGARASVARAYYPAGTARIVLSRMATPAWHEDSNRIACPTLVLHGTDDPIFPPAHGEDMAARIPSASLQWLEGAGHNHPLALQGVITDAIVKFLAEHS